MPADEKLDPWVRLGELLLARRAQLNRRFANRQLFVNTTGLDYRVAYDVEKAKRQNFSDRIKVAIEEAYRLQSGEFDRILDGAEPSPIPASGASQPEVMTPVEPEAKADSDDVIEREAFGRLDAIMQILRADAAARLEQEERIARLEQEAAEMRDELQELRERKAQERDGESNRNSRGA